MLRIYLSGVQGWFSTHVLPVLGAWMAACPTSSKSVLGKGFRNITSLRSGIKHTHTHGVPGLVLCKTCPGNWLSVSTGQAANELCQSCRGAGGVLAEGVFWSQKGTLLGHSGAEAALCGIQTPQWLLEWFS